MEQKQFLANALKESRLLAGVSQEYLAFELGVARKTVQNWEKAISEPSIHQAMCWFKILKISPLPYLFQYIYPDMEGMHGNDNAEILRKNLITLVENLPEEAVRQLLFLLYGDHGSAPRAVLNLVTAHLQTPMRDRVVAANVVIKNYELAKQQKMIISPTHVQPNMELLHNAINKGEIAAVNNVTTYAPMN